MSKRDPERLLAAIRRAHEAFPDLRVMQIIANAIGHDADPYYLENDGIAARILAWLDMQLPCARCRELEEHLRARMACHECVSAAKKEPCHLWCRWLETKRLVDRTRETEGEGR